MTSTWESFPATDDELVAASGAPWLPLPLPYTSVPPWNPAQGGEFVERYGYTGPDGEPRFEVLRFRPAAGVHGRPAKAFLSRSPAARSGWKWGLQGCELVLYRLPRVQSAIRAGERVFVVEGERDVHTLEAAGLATTCNPLGGLQWVEAYSEALAGADVAVVPDNDPVGRVHAALVACSLRGHARSVRVVLLPDLTEGEDVSDWLDRGNTATELVRLADEAPRDPDDEKLAGLLQLPRSLSLAERSPENVRALLVAATYGAGAGPFVRTLTRLRRVGVTVPPASSPSEMYWALVRATASAHNELRPLLEDAFGRDRDAYELRALATQAAAARPPAHPIDAEAASARVWLSPDVRIVRTRFDWEADVAGPPRPGNAVLALKGSASGIHVQPLSAFAALILEASRTPATLAHINAKVGEALGGEGRADIPSLVRSQVDQLCAAGLAGWVQNLGDVGPDALRSRVTSPSEGSEGARNAAAVLARATIYCRELLAESSADPEREATLAYDLDLSAGMLAGLLQSAGLAPFFHDPMNRYWNSAHPSTRHGHLDEVVTVLERAIRPSSGWLAPFAF